LTNFEYEAHTMIGKESDETCCEKIVKSRQANFLGRVLAIWNHCLHQLPTTVLSQIMERKKFTGKKICEPI